MEKPFTSLISVQELVESATPSWRIFDCRFRLADPAAGKRAYVEGHLPGAMFLDLEEDLSGPVSGLNGRHPLPHIATLAAAFWRTLLPELPRGCRQIWPDDDADLLSYLINPPLH